MKRPYDSTISFAVHGVHLVDAIQNFGPEYELLFSSCKPQPVPSSSNASLSQSKSKLPVASVCLWPFESFLLISSVPERVSFSLFIEQKKAFKLRPC